MRKTMSSLHKQLSTAAIVVAGVTVGLMPLQAQASSDTYTLMQPENFSNGSEVPALKVPGDSTLGNGSWQADPSLTGSDGQQHLIYLQGDQPGPAESGPVSYPAAGANPRLLFPLDNNVTMGDIVSISWDTKRPSGTSATEPDWFLDVFTRPDGENDAAWYGRNFDFIAGSGDDNSSFQAGEWNTWVVNGASGSAAGIPVKFFDNDNPGFPPQYIDLSAPDNSLSGSDDILSEEIWFLALGTATNYDGFDGLIDNFRFSYRDNNDEIQSVVVDFEAEAASQSVPEPTTGLVGSALAALGLVAYRRRHGISD